MKIEMKQFIEIWYTDGSRETKMFAHLGEHKNLLRSILPEGVFAYRYFIRFQAEFDRGLCLAGEPPPLEDTFIYFHNCDLVVIGGTNGVEFFAQNSVGNKYPFREGDVLILSGRGKNGYVRKIFVRKGNNVNEEAVN